MSYTVPYTAIEHHGIIGDRRTAALVGNDGSIDWLCLPDYDGVIVFGSLLDYGRGGSFRLGPAARQLADIDGETEWAEHRLRWKGREGELVLADVMAWPAVDSGDSRPRQAVLRCLRCVRGRVRCSMTLETRADFAPADVAAISPHEATYAAGSHRLRVWSDGPLEVEVGAVRREFELREGEESWTVLTLGDEEPWTVDRARRLHREAHSYWTQWLETLSYRGSYQAQARRAGLLVHLLSHAPSGSLVAAPTTSLPERIGGDWNADYRFAWVRDASLSLTALSRLGNTKDCKHYLEWLCTLDSSTDAPLQPLYGIRGETKLSQVERGDLQGYRGSRPVRFGNHAFHQHQIDALGYLAECMEIYLRQDGSWENEFWELLERCVDYISASWTELGNSIWELPKPQHYLSGKVMSWVGLDRAIAVARRLGKHEAAARWHPVRQRIHAEILARGWNAEVGSFTQRYEGQNLDAAALLVPVMDFLPPDDPRVISTVEQVVRHLTNGHFCYRFDPLRTPEIGHLPMGEFEGAFLPCTFWLATAYLKLGRIDEAREILDDAGSIGHPLGLFAEGVDVRARSFLGNFPLLFSHAEYVRAVTEIP